MHLFFYDTSQPDFQENAFEIDRVLRNEHPVYHHPEGGFWAISRCGDVWSAANDRSCFSNEGTPPAMGELPQVQALDPPYHDQLRALLSAPFTPRRVAAMEPLIRAIVRSLLDPTAEAGRCDLHADFAGRVPNRVIRELIGVPRERQEKFLH